MPLVYKPTHLNRLSRWASIQGEAQQGNTPEIHNRGNGNQQLPTSWRLLAWKKNAKINKQDNKFRRKPGKGRVKFLLLLLLLLLLWFYKTPNYCPQSNQGNVQSKEEVQDAKKYEQWRTQKVSWKLKMFAEIKNNIHK